MEHFWRSGDFLCYVSRKTYSWVCGQILPGARVVDIGCATGTGTDLLAQTASLAKGLDVEQLSIAFARSMYIRPSFEVWDISVSPFPGQWDIVVAVEVLEHIKDYPEALRCMLRTAPMVFISTMNRQSKELRNDRPTYRPHVREFTPAEVVELAEAAEGRVEGIWDVEGTEVDVTTETTSLIYLIKEHLHG